MKKIIILSAICLVIYQLTAAPRANKLSQRSLKKYDIPQCSELEMLADKVRTAQTPSEREHYKKLHDSFCTALKEIVEHIQYTEATRHMTRNNRVTNHVIGMSKLIQRNLETSIKTALKQ